MTVPLCRVRSLPFPVPAPMPMYTTSVSPLEVSKITVEPLFHHVERWPLSLPHYTVGHLQLVDTIDERVASHRGLALAGNAYRGVGVPDCVKSGEAAAAALADALD